MKKPPQTASDAWDQRVRSIAARWWQRFINAVAPIGYQDEQGFHLDVYPPKAGSVWDFHI